MNLIEESFQEKKDVKRKKATTIILVAMAILVILIIAIVVYLFYIQSTTLKLAIDGQVNEKFKQLLVFEADDKIYAPIKEIASYFGYESYNGEYKEKSEDPSKCYVQSENEAVNFTLSSNKIYKLELSKDENYEYVYLKEPIKAINGVLYTTTQGLEEAFNISFNYNKEKNRIDIYTLPYLIKSYSNSILDLGYSEISSELVNQKSIFDNVLIVKKQSNSTVGAIDLNGNVIIEPKYDKITYLPNTGDFLVESNGKVGIVSKTRETKVQIAYDSIELMDIDAGLYVVKRNNKYGIIDTNGNIKLHIENDQVGIDVSKFSENNIKSKYILIDTFIPVRKDKLWALFDKRGNQVTDFIYDSFGYIASNNKDAINLLEIPDYKVLVACKNQKYTLINTSGKQLFDIIADDIYMTISGGNKHYYIIANNNRFDAETLLDKSGVKNVKEENSQTSTNTQSDTTSNNQANTNDNFLSYQEIDKYVNM